VAYTKQTWANGSSGGTPLSALRLQYLEDGVQALSDLLVAGTYATTAAVAGTYATTAAVAGGYTPLAHVTATDPHGDRAYTDSQQAVLGADPLGLGPVCILGAFSAVTWGAANDGVFTRLLGGGTISKISFHAGTLSGNAIVGAFSGAGVGRSRVPATRLAASASTAIVSGYNEIALTSTVTVKAGDFLFLAVDNTTAAIAALNGLTSNVYSGLYYKQSSSFSTTPSVGTLVATGAKVPQLSGVA
jgi:hypothetical protein